MCWPSNLGIVFATENRIVFREKNTVTITKAIGVNGEPAGVKAAIRSAEDALTGILSRHSPALYRTAVRNVGNAEDASGTRTGIPVSTNSLSCKRFQKEYASDDERGSRCGKVTPQTLHSGAQVDSQACKLFAARGRRARMALALQVVSSHALGALDIESALSNQPNLAKRLLPHAVGEADALKRQQFPRLFLLDGCSLTLPLGPLTSRLRANSPGSRFFVLLPPERSGIAEMIRLFHWGVDGMLALDKKWRKELPKAVLVVLTNRVWAPPEVLLAFVSQMKILLDRQLLPGESLTMREGQVLQLLFRQFTNKEIACELKITERTAKFHVSNLLNKLDLENRKNLDTFGQLESI
jgi:DNA-binding NarL/FixJ family response regulator